MQTLVKHKYAPETPVFLIHDPEQHPRFIKYIAFGAGTELYYTLICGTEESIHLESELTDLKAI